MDVYVDLSLLSLVLTLLMLLKLVLIILDVSGDGCRDVIEVSSLLDFLKKADGVGLLE